MDTRCCLWHRPTRPLRWVCEVCLNCVSVLVRIQLWTVYFCLGPTGQGHQGSQLHPGQPGDNTEPDHSAGSCHQADGGEPDSLCFVKAPVLLILSAQVQQNLWYTLLLSTQPIIIISPLFNRLAAVSWLRIELVFLRKKPTFWQNTLVRWKIFLLCFDTIGIHAQSPPSLNCNCNWWDK